MQLDLAERYIMERLADELPPQLTYHNALHTKDVYQAAQRIAASEGVGERDGKLLFAAALFHDTGFLMSDKNHETHSCSIAKEALPVFGFTAPDISRVCTLIMATKIPQQPKNLLEAILCDADLDYLGRDDFFERSQLLYNEMRYLGTVASRKAYDALQRIFFQNHHYFTHTAIRTRNEQKEKNYHKLIAQST